MPVPESAKRRCSSAEHLRYVGWHMNADQIFATLAGPVFIALVIWFFWLGKRKGLRAALAPLGIQEVLVTVKVGYSPDRVVVEHGKPVRLMFRREETDPRSEMVMLPDFHKSATLPQGELVSIEFLPAAAGEYEFHSQMSMIRGTLLVQ